MRRKLQRVPILTLSLLWLLIPLAVVQAATYYLDFENPLSNEWEIVGDVEIVSENSHSGQYCLKLGTMGRAIIPVSDNNVYGKVTFWVKDSMIQVPSTTSPKVGPVFGLRNKDGDMLLFGILRRSFLDLSKYGYVFTAENNFYSLWYIDIPRTGEWQKWTIEVSEPGIVNVYVNDTLKSISDSKKQYFSKGFTGVYFRGDNLTGPEEFKFDDVTVEIAGPGQIDQHDFPEPRIISSILQDPNFFPIAVWLQPLDYMDYYKAMGVNIFIGESARSGVTQKQFLDGLHSKGLYGIVRPGSANEADPQIMSELKNNPALLGWMHGDEPDNAPGGVQKRYPEEVKQLYDQIGTLDSEHSVYLNLGSGVGDPERRQTKTTNYYGYCEGTDIISFDIYPVASYPSGEKVLYFVADGIDNLKKWSNNKKPIWIWLEASDIGGNYRYATPEELRAEVWMAIIHGADGIGWFPHVFNPYAWKDIPPELEVEITHIGQTLKTLAPVINSSERDDVQIEMLTQGRVDAASRINDNKLYFFVVNMMNKNAECKLILPDSHSSSRFKEIYEDRTIQSSEGSFTEKFGPYEVHLYEEISDVPPFDKDIELTIRFDKKKVSETDVLFISGNTEEGAVIEEVKLLDENNNVLNVNVKDKISIDDKGNITGQVALTDIIEKCPLVSGIKIRMKVRKGDRTGEEETELARIEPYRTGPDRTEVKCYNNMFNPLKGEKAIIEVSLKDQGKVSIYLYDTKGSKIKRLADEEKEAGTYRYYWDGRNDSGNVIGNGLYFVHIQAGDYIKTKKIVVIK